MPVLWYHIYQSYSLHFGLAYAVLFLILGAFLTVVTEVVRSFSIRPELDPFPNADTSLDEPCIPLDEPTAFNISVSSGSDDGWHSSMSIARSSVREAWHCNRTNACRCRRRTVYDDIAWASSDSDGRGDDVASMASDIDRFHNVGSMSVGS